MLRKMDSLSCPRTRSMLLDFFHKCLGSDSFAHHTWDQFGRSVHWVLENEFDDDPREVVPSFLWFRQVGIGHAGGLALWVYGGGGFDLNWLSDDEGKFYSDDGSALSVELKPVYSEVQHFAAYAIWLLETWYLWFGDVEGLPGDDCYMNESGHNVNDVMMHQIACLMQASQLQMMIVEHNEFSAQKTNNQEADKILAAEYSRRGRLGAQVKKGKRKHIVDFVIQKWESGDKSNASQEAYHLRAQVAKMMTEAGIPFSESGLQKLIAEWIRKHEKSV